MAKVKTLVMATNASIREGVMYGVKLKVSYQTALFQGGPKAHVQDLTIDCNGVPLTRLFEIFWNALKVSRQTVERESDSIEAIEEFSGTELSWLMAGRKFKTEQQVFDEAIATTSAMTDEQKLALAKTLMAQANH